MPETPYNASKVALLIEDRVMPSLAPLLLHFIYVLPPDWRLMFMGSIDSVAHINKSAAIREHVANGKLDLEYIPSNMSTASQEMISRFLTSLWLYETVLRPAEWVLVFQTDSIICANSRRSIDDYLEFDWIGAPWNVSHHYGGNGGLSLRRVSSIIEVLRTQTRVDGSEPEDVWFSNRLAHRHGAKMANFTTSLSFAGETYAGMTVDPSSVHGNFLEGSEDSHSAFYEPMGYHIGGSGTTFGSDIWGTPELRNHIWNYCPEIKMILAMDAAKFIPDDCYIVW